mmetsp:Transcript_8934/g.18153  ORF Transcript_8934/g.18153 Transcript_8934/m.18153 type:complete len:203 (+) Transcript_8934:419-1027(+)
MVFSTPAAFSSTGASTRLFAAGGSGRRPGLAARRADLGRILERTLLTELGEGAKKGAKEDERALNVRDADGLADRVHRPARRAQVDGAQPRLARDDRTNSRATWAVVLDHKLLNANAGTACELSHEEAALTVGRVALVVIRLDDSALIELRRVCRLVLLCIVGMYSMGRVSRHQKRLPRRDEEALGRRMRIFGGEARRHALH